MFKSIKTALAGLAGVFALGTCAGCATAPYIPGSQTVDAVQEVCTGRPVDQTVYCLTGVYDGLVFALAEERAAGSLSPEIDARINTAVQFLSPRVVTVKEAYATVSALQTQVDTLKPLAEKCVELATQREDAAEGAATGCLIEIGYLAMSGKLSEAVADASAQWGALEPRLRDFITLSKKEIEQ